MTAIDMLENELKILRRSRDQAAAQIVTAKNALDAGSLILSDLSTRIERIEICLNEIKASESKDQ